MKEFLVLGIVLASFGAVDRAYAQEGPAGAGRAGDYRFIAVPSKDEVSPFFGQEARYGHKVYGAIMLNVGR